MLCFWWFSPKNESPPPDIGEVFVELVKRPLQPIVKPPEQVEEPPQAAILEEVEKTPTPPKPRADLSSDWFTVDSNEDIGSTVEKRRQGNHNSPPNPEDTPTDGTLVPNTKGPQRPNTRITNEELNRNPFALSTSSKTTPVGPQAETSRITLDTNDTLNGVSPTVDTPKIHFGGRRGDALRATGIGNTSGGGSTSGGGKAGGIYIKMMKDIAQQLTAATTTKKVDVVFVLDETASMIDNIRGIRAYFELIFDAFERDGRDATYGLVTFTDKTKTHGQTADLGAFKNWLFKIDVDRGGDISEAGLDALMAAVKKIKFRRNAQRFFIIASDAAFHDADYDGRSSYSLDEVIATLQKERVRVEVIGLDYLPIKQIAMATGGTWRAIPGKGFLEYVPPLTLTEKMLSKLGTLGIDGGTVGDKIIVYVNNPPRPKHLTLTWKVLNPLGERCYGPFKEKKEIPDDTSTQIELTPELNTEAFQTIPGTYTVIYRLENDRGHKSILRRTLKHQ